MNKSRPSSWREHLEYNASIDRRILRDATQAALEQSGAPLDQIEVFKVTFVDEFAPSSAEVGTNDPGSLVGPGKILNYGEDWHNHAMAAISRAMDFGFPSLDWPFLGTYTKVSEAQQTAIMPALGQIIACLEEHSDDWLCLNIYLHVLSLSNLYTENAHASLVFSETFIIGGLVRELDLSLRNRDEAIERKKAKRAFAEANEGRSELNRTRRENAMAWQKHAEEVLKTLSQVGTNSAIARHILLHWDAVGDAGNRPPKRSKKTIQNWLSQKPSRTRSSPGK